MVYDYLEGISYQPHIYGLKSVKTSSCIFADEGYRSGTLIAQGVNVQPRGSRLAESGRRRAWCRRFLKS
jgi:hypothetical protein